MRVERAQRHRRLDGGDDLAVLPAAPDIFSFDDLAIQRGLRMVYHHRNIDRKLFEKYRRRFHPYCSVASLYLWAVSGGAIPEMKDFKVKK